MKKRRQKKKRCKKETPHSVYKKCLKVASDIAKTRDGYTCQICGVSRESGKQIQASHVIPKSKCKRLAIEPINIKALCSYCHRWRWHLSPCEFGIWYIETFPERWEEIQRLQRIYQAERKPGIVYFRNQYIKLTETRKNER
jgi:5-methylcytosine-specific restriction endonuclease McrA